jgi:phage terminase large subunit
LELHQLMDTHRFGVTVAHRRFGKSVGYFNELQKRALSTTKERYRASYFAPYYAQAKSIMWDYAKHFSSVVPGVTHNEAELRVDYPNGARVRLHGADNPGAGKGLYFDDVVFDEFDQMKMETWTQVVRPALADRVGNAYFIGTFEYTNGPLGRIYDIAKGEHDWFTRIFRASETGIIPEAELKAARRVMSEDEYLREFECVRSAAVRGAIYGRLIDELEAAGRITQVPYDPSLGVVTAWDLGMGDSTAIWFAQLAGREVRLIDYYEVSGQGLPECIDALQSKPYSYRDHIAPHDINVREWLGNGRTRLEVARQLGINFRPLPRISQTVKSEVDERIDVARRLIPRCVFDAEKTKPGVDALRSYRREVSNRTGEYHMIPLHDWSSHGADAFGYLAQGLWERKSTADRPRPSTRWIV